MSEPSNTNHAAMRWRRAFNPYRVNAFTILALGPSASPRECSAMAQEWEKLLLSGMALEVGGQKLELSAVRDACNRLSDRAGMAQELLWVHADPQHAPERLAVACSEVERLASAPPDRDPLLLTTPAGLFYFIPAPSADEIPRPQWNELGLVDAGDPEDLQLDIVFDQ